MLGTVNQADIDSSTWLVLLIRHRGKASLFFIVAMAMVVLATAFASRWYRSEAALYFRLGRENAALDPTAVVGERPILMGPGSREREVNSMMEILKSRGMAEALVDKVGHEAILADASGRDEHSPATRGAKSLLKFSPEIGERERAILHVAKRLEIDAAEDANLVWIGYEARSPDFAQQILNSFIETYLAKHVQFHRHAGSRDFLAKQAEEAKNALTKAEEELAEVQQQTLLVAPIDQRQALVALAAKLEADLLDNEAAEAALATRVKKLKSMLREVPATETTARTSGVSNDAADRMRDQLYALQIREQELLSRHTSENPVLQIVQKQIADARAILDSENNFRTQTTEGVNPAHEAGRISLFELSPLLESLRRKSTALNQKLADARKQLLELSVNELQTARLQREVDLAETEYRRYVSGLNQAKLDEALEIQRISNINVVQSPTFSAKPVRPSWRLNLALGLLFAGGGSWAVAALADRWPTTLHVGQPTGDRQSAADVAPIPRPTTA